jgi:SpoIIAA-like
MPIAMERERDNVFRVEVRGMLRWSELESCQGRLAGEMSRIGPVRLLFVLDGFEGWEPDARWNDLSFYVRHGDSIERIAIVGPERWRDMTMMFAAADLRKAPVEFFREGAAGEARAWLSS